jgi:hypothetical protein
MEAMEKTNTFMKINLLIVFVIYILVTSCTNVYDNILITKSSTNPQKEAYQISKRLSLKGFKVKCDSDKILLYPPQEYGSSFAYMLYDPQNIYIKVKTIGPHIRRPESHYNLEKHIEKLILEKNFNGK